MTTALLPHQDSNLDTPVNSRTLCRLSYRGSEHAAILERIFARVEVDAGGCWLFTGAVSNKGYGQVGVDGRTRSTHRVVYEAIHGSLEPTLQVDHACHNRDLACPGGVTCHHRRCVNPSHLEAVTPLVNVNRAGHGLEVKCKRGHPLSGDNLFIKKRGGLVPSRGCRACRTVHQQQYRERRKLRAPAP